MLSKLILTEKIMRKKNFKIQMLAGNRLKICVGFEISLTLFTSVWKFPESVVPVVTFICNCRLYNINIMIYIWLEPDPRPFLFYEIRAIFWCTPFLFNFDLWKEVIKVVPFPYLPNVKDLDNRLNLHFSHCEFKA